MNLGYFRKQKFKYEVMGLFLYSGILSAIFLITQWYDAVSKRSQVLIVVFVIALILIVIAIYIAYEAGFDELNTAFKKEVIEKGIKEHQSSYQLCGESTFDKKEFIEAKVLKKRTNGYEFKDMVCGDYRGVHVESSYVESIARGRGVYFKVYSGRVYRLKFEHPFKNDVLLNQRLFMLGLDEVKIEEISDEFNVYVNSKSNESIEELFTPSLKSLLLDLQSKYRGYVSLSFRENNLYIEFGRRKSFDLVRFRRIRLWVLRQFLKELQDIEDLIYGLQNEPIFKLS